MQRNLNLELVPPSVSLHCTTASADDDNRLLDLFCETPTPTPTPRDEKQQQHQRLTFFDNGRIGGCDVTELQARAIISLARRETEERFKSPTSYSVTPINNLESQLSSSKTGLSMKRSLQRFLQKRKSRIQATCPYNP